MGRFPAIHAASWRDSIGMDDDQVWFVSEAGELREILFLFFVCNAVYQSENWKLVKEGWNEPFWTYCRVLIIAHLTHYSLYTTKIGKLYLLISMQRVIAYEEIAYWTKGVVPTTRPPRFGHAPGAKRLAFELAMIQLSASSP